MGPLREAVGNSGGGNGRGEEASHASPILKNPKNLTREDYDVIAGILGGRAMVSASENGTRLATVIYSGSNTLGFETDKVIVATGLFDPVEVPTNLVVAIKGRLFLRNQVDNEVTETEITRAGMGETKKRPAHALQAEEQK